VKVVTEVIDEIKTLGPANRFIKKMPLHVSLKKVGCMPLNQD